MIKAATFTVVIFTTLIFGSLTKVDDREHSEINSI